MGNFRSNPINEENKLKAKLLEKYTIFEIINDIRYGPITILYDPQTNEKYCLKDMLSKNNDEINNQNVYYKKRMEIKHPNIIELISYKYIQVENLCTKMCKFFLLLEYVDSDLEADLASFTSNNKFYTIEELTSFSECLIDALSKLQSIGISHGDIKPQTIFINQLRQYKIAEKNIIEQHMPSYFQILSGSKNIQCYLSPALLSSLKKEELHPNHNPYKSDVFALGMVILYVGLMKNPYMLYDFKNYQINEEELQENLEIFKKQYGQRLFSIVSEMLIFDEELRPDFLSLIKKFRIKLGEMTQSEVTTAQNVSGPTDKSSTKTEHSNSTTKRIRHEEKSAIYANKKSSPTPIIKQLNSRSPNSRRPSQVDIIQNKIQKLSSREYLVELKPNNDSQAINAEKDQSLFIQESNAFIEKIPETRNFLISNMDYELPGLIINNSEAKWLSIPEMTQSLMTPAPKHLIENKSNFNEIPHIQSYHNSVESPLVEVNLLSPKENNENIDIPTNYPPLLDISAIPYQSKGHNFDSQLPFQISLTLSNLNPYYNTNENTNNILVNEQIQQESNVNNLISTNLDNIMNKNVDSGTYKNFYDKIDPYSFLKATNDYIRLHNELTIVEEPNKIMKNDKFLDKASSTPELHQLGTQKVLTESCLPEGVSKVKMNSTTLDHNRKKSLQLDSHKLELSRITYPDGATYYGEILQGKRHGYGIFRYSDGGLYEGEWKNGVMDGKGTLYYDEGKIAYQGDWLNEQFHGKGIVYNETPKDEEEFNFKDFNTLGENWIKYEGEFSTDNKNGFGVLYMLNGDKYEGEFKDDIINGKGIYYFNNGEKLVGIWNKNILIQIIDS